MKQLPSIRTLLVSLIAGATAMIAIPSISFAENVNVVLMMGQSNMDGRAKNKKLEDLSVLENDTIIWYRNPAFLGSNGCSTDSWNDIQLGYSLSPGRTIKDDCISTRFGPEIGFADYVSKRSTTPLALIKFSEGGTNLRSDWNPKFSGYLYDLSLAAYASAMTDLQSDGKTGTLKAILWHQGEGDAGYTRKWGADNYAAKLNELISSYRSALGNSSLPFIIGELYDDGNRDEIIQAQRDVAASDPNIGIVSNEGLKSWDDTHFNSKSQITLGSRFGAEYLQMVD